MLRHRIPQSPMKLLLRKSISNHSIMHGPRVTKYFFDGELACVNREFRSTFFHSVNERRSSNSSENAQKEEQNQNEMRPSKATMFGIALGACAIGAYLNIRNYENNSVAKVSGIQSSGKPSLGGPFQLLDHHNKPVSDSDFRGKWMFIYFGFTYCPDICPNELIRMREVVDILDSSKETAGRVQPIFITIDPARDGPAQLKSYLADWHPRLIGLTGTQDQINDVCRKYRVYFSKAQLGPNPMDYLIDHSVMFYLVDPNGTFEDYYAKNVTPQQMASRISTAVLALPSSRP